MGVGSQRRGARSYTCGLRSDPQALGSGAHIRVDLSQPPDESRLRVFDPDHRSVDLCDDDPTDAQKASEGHRVRASQTPSERWLGKETGERRPAMESGQPRSNLTKLSETELPLEEPWQDMRGLDVY